MKDDIDKLAALAREAAEKRQQALLEHWKRTLQREPVSPEDWLEKLEAFNSAVIELERQGAASAVEALIARHDPREAPEHGTAKYRHRKAFALFLAGRRAPPDAALVVAAAALAALASKDPTAEDDVRVWSLQLLARCLVWLTEKSKPAPEVGLPDLSAVRARLEQAIVKTPGILWQRELRAALEVVEAALSDAGAGQ